MIIIKTKVRRDKLLQRLKKSKEALIGSQLAEEFGVSRQVIVQDVALLRAEGEKIVATSQGYFYEENLGMTTVKTSIACSHGDQEELKDELLTVVNYGGRVIDVKVEHPIYGDLSGNLMISNIEEVDNFIKNYQNNEAQLLSKLTEGVHLHTIEAVNMQVLKKIKEELKEKGYLMEE
ncbi:Transcriptional repressor for NAD biosynthesis in gram-positives [Halanaerobium saccharolyticum subsp. saccharolyticum DSM 6643]|uniref:Transcriptional repressor for NAD biosynthesis in gram-positives n=1 Tax=Halanaerobium saccharolyticum subsp. saccharolyticum DSM 6643 TaxID=1293054 RepID=M5EFK1_9FIRM|nr:transcription repressor NadR [Halanaerobium saccharolyticum]CCU79973.1 Transcriptional repressor for NAD biosynthesis in gram-positives [Halanaerobium saccharolyticum subsp. saccharolyticum DSM 6643]